ncbi:hypothetical protein ACQPYA_27760 [Micromonospora sp. CA-263727]|uniref:hypothetical protein n=1 Tax=Micromonospora sp. CA-263727 TaxID=3239967 RepID=UPI003D8DC1C1
MTAALHDDNPPSGEWTTDGLDRLPDDGRRREILDGNLIVSPSPTRLHQSIALMLGAALQESCPADLDAASRIPRATGRTGPDQPTEPLTARPERGRPTSPGRPAEDPP